MSRSPRYSIYYPDVKNQTKLEAVTIERIFTYFHGYTRIFPIFERRATVTTLQKQEALAARAAQAMSPLANGPLALAIVYRMMIMTIKLTTRFLDRSQSRSRQRKSVEEKNNQLVYKLVNAYKRVVDM